MKPVSFIAIAITAAASYLGLGPADAQSLSDIQAPAEFPPDSYTGRQYVDSEGCVFVRAGIDGHVTWVPRVSRNRQIICGFQPSFPQTEPQAEIASTTAEMMATSDPEPDTNSDAEQVIGDTVSSEPEVSPQTTKKETLDCDCENADEPCGTQTSAQIEAQPAQNSVTNTSVDTASMNVSASQPKSSRRAVTEKTVSSHTRVAPRRVYENQIASRQGVYIPKGYKAVWDDDRLNPYRMHQTFAGKVKMEQIWTNTIPRKLIHRESGRKVVYADTDPVATVSTRSNVNKAQPAAASHRYVQAGVFAQMSQAELVAQKMANSGLPTKLGKVKRTGKTYGVVIVGPYRSQSQLDDAYRRVRAMGFKSATLRK